MSNLYLVTDDMIRKERKTVDKRLAALLTDLGHESMFVPESALGILKRALKIYRGIKPVLSVIAKLPIMPPMWAAILDALMRALDALSVPEVIGEITTKFKAGKDLQEAA